GGLFLQEAAGRLLGLLALGQVPGDFREAAQLALLVAQGGEDDAGPEEGAVLAYPPALVLEAPLGPSDRQLVGRPAAVDGLLRVEAGEVLPEDLLGPVPLDPLRAGVPADDVALRIQQKDGVIGGAVHQQPQLLRLVLSPDLLLEKLDQPRHLGPQ